MTRRTCLLITATFLLLTPGIVMSDDASLQLTLRSREKTADGFVARDKKVEWEAKKTALIICDMWDDHWCKSASRRCGELTPAINDVVKLARKRGVLIIHAPSSVTAFYKDTPQRKLALDAPFAKTPVPLVTRFPCRARRVSFKPCNVHSSARSPAW